VSGVFCLFAVSPFRRFPFFLPIPLFILFSSYPFPNPDKHFPILIDRYPLGIDQLGFEVSEIVVVKIELALEGAVRDASLTLQPGTYLFGQLREFHGHSSFPQTAAIEPCQRDFAIEKVYVPATHPEEKMRLPYTQSQQFRLAMICCLLSQLLLATITAADTVTPSTNQPDIGKGLTAVAGIKVGHHTLRERPTGCTVILVEAGAVAGVDVRGSAPGTRETDLLNPINMVEQVHAIVLSGGSAFGLDAASGVVRYLEEKGIGFDVRVAKIPIVPAAILFDLGIGDAKIRPTAECGYQAAQAATTDAVQEGNVGAGAGATVGKLTGMNHAMKAGIGTASLTLPDGLTVAALVAVNAAGDIIDPTTGRVIAGVRGEDGKGLADSRALLKAGTLRQRTVGQNTTIGVVATNARLTKVQAAKIAQMAHDGFARAIYPVHTPVDGDTIFAVATGTHKPDADLLTVGALAADAMAEAIVRAARATTGIPGYPAARDLSEDHP
jgi:L-aminopeptidase/D-esterase-like protein